jgi:hypothetical protein
MKEEKINEWKEEKKLLLLLSHHLKLTKSGRIDIAVCEINRKEENYFLHFFSDARLKSGKHFFHKKMLHVSCVVLAGDDEIRKSEKK